MPTSRSYHSYLIESLRDPYEAAAYLDAVMEECNCDELQLALKNIAEARLTDLDGSHVTLNNDDRSEKTLSSLTSLDLSVLRHALNELGFKLSITPMEDAA